MVLVVIYLGRNLLELVDCPENVLVVDEISEFQINYPQNILHAAIQSRLLLFLDHRIVLLLPGLHVFARVVQIYRKICPVFRELHLLILLLEEVQLNQVLLYLLLLLLLLPVKCQVLLLGELVLLVLHENLLLESLVDVLLRLDLPHEVGLRLLGRAALLHQTLDFFVRVLQPILDVLVLPVNLRHLFELLELGLDVPDDFRNPRVVR